MCCVYLSVNICAYFILNFLIKIDMNVTVNNKNYCIQKKKSICYVTYKKYFKIVQ